MNNNTSLIRTYISAIRETAANLPVQHIEKAVRILDEARTNGNQVYLFGNGGSAATASHLAVDLSKGTIDDGRPHLRTAALTDNIALISAWANDASYDDIFARQIECQVRPGDVVIGISSRGRSANVLNGLRRAKSCGATTIALTGFDGGSLNGMVDVCIVVPANSIEQVEDVHLMVGHMLTECLRNHR